MKNNVIIATLLVYIYIVMHTVICTSSGSPKNGYICIISLTGLTCSSMLFLRIAKDCFIKAAMVALLRFVFLNSVIRSLLCLIKDALSSPSGICKGMVDKLLYVVICTWRLFPCYRICVLAVLPAVQT